MPGVSNTGKFDKDSVFGTMTVALLVCLVCSIVVSVAAVYLKPVQEINKTLDRKRNILQVVGLYDPAGDVEEQFKQFETRIVELETGEYAPSIDPETYDQRKAQGNPELSHPLAGSEDPASIKRLEKYSQIYIVRESDSEDAAIRYMVLPVRGYGLWSTLYGYLALEGDGKTIVGLSFYEHAETPGLGGEVDNPKWKSQWAGKLAYDEGGWEPAAGVAKGKAPVGSEHLVDGLSGASLTSRGVNDLVKFWLSEDGYQPFIKRVAG